MVILRELWERDRFDPEVKSTYKHVLDLRNRLEDTCKRAHEELECTSESYLRFYNLGSRERSMKPVNQALLLFPTEANKLTMQCKGPFRIIENLERWNT